MCVLALDLRDCKILLSRQAFNQQNHCERLNYQDFDIKCMKDIAAIDIVDIDIAEVCNSILINLFGILMLAIQGGDAHVFKN